MASALFPILEAILAYPFHSNIVHIGFTQLDKSDIISSIINFLKDILKYNQAIDSLINSVVDNIMVPTLQYGVFNRFKCIVFLLVRSDFELT